MSWCHGCSGWARSSSARHRHSLQLLEKRRMHPVCASEKYIPRHAFTQAQVSCRSQSLGCLARARTPITWLTNVPCVFACQTAKCSEAFVHVWVLPRQKQMQRQAHLHQDGRPQVLTCSSHAISSLNKMLRERSRSLRAAFQCFLQVRPGQLLLASGSTTAVCSTSNFKSGNQALQTTLHVNMYTESNW